MMAMDEQDAIISLLNSESDSESNSSEKPGPPPLNLFKYASCYSSTPPPPPLKVSVDSASSSSSEDEKIEATVKNTPRLAVRRRPLAASLGAHELHVKTTGLHLPRWPPNPPSSSTPYKSPSPGVLSPPRLARGCDDTLEFPAMVSPEGDEGGVSPRVSTPIGMPLHLSEGIEELGACSRRLLFSSDGGIGDRHVLLEDRELEILCLGEGEAAGKTKRTVKKGKGKSSRACVEKSLASVGLEGGAEGNPNGKKDKGMENDMVAPSVVTLASSTGQGEKVDRGSILGGAIRRPVKRSVSEGSKTDRENSGREGERLRPSPAILLEVNPCTFPQQLNGFAKGEGSGEKMDSKLQVPQMVKKKGKGIRSGTKKAPAPFKPKKIDRVAAFHKYEVARKQDDKRMRALRKSISASFR